VNRPQREIWPPAIAAQVRDVARAVAITALEGPGSQGGAQQPHPLITRRIWLVAFGFGLVDGFGFASVLAGLGLPQDALLLALFGFNLGIEAGQLAIVLAIMPIAFWLRQS
jgi:HupE / UreJ protein